MEMKLDIAQTVCARHAEDGDSGTNKQQHEMSLQHMMWII